MSSGPENSNAEELEGINALFAGKKKPAPTDNEEERRRTHNNKIMKIKLRIIGAIIVLIIGIIIKILLKKEKRMIDTPMKYVNTKILKEAVNSFLASKDASDISVLYGTKGFGKTRGLNNAIDQLKSFGKFVVNLDFSVLTKDAHIKDIITVIKSSFVTAFKNAEIYNPSIKSAYPTVASLVSIVGKEPKNIGGFIDPTMRNLASSFCVLIDTIGVNPSSIDLIMRGLDAIGHVFIVVNEPQNAIKLPIYEDFIKAIQESASDAHKVSCIAEVSDVEWLLNQPERSHVNRVRVGEFSLEEAKADLTGDFKPRQVSEMFDKFGGNGRLFAQVHETMRQDYDFREAVDYVSKVELLAINQAISRMPEGTLPVLVNLAKGPVEINFSDPIARFLIDEYLATPIKFGILSPSSPVLFNKAINQYIKQLSKETPKAEQTNNTTAVNQTVSPETKKGK